MTTATEHRPQTVGDLQEKISRLEKELVEKAAIAEDLGKKFRDYTLDARCSYM